MRRIPRVLGIVTLVVAVVLMTGQARAVIIYETGQELGYRTFFGTNCGVGIT